MEFTYFCKIRVVRCGSCVVEIGGSAMGECITGLRRLRCTEWNFVDLSRQIVRTLGKLLRCFFNDGFCRNLLSSLRHCPLSDRLSCHDDSAFQERTSSDEIRDRKCSDDSFPSLVSQLGVDDVASDLPFIERIGFSSIEDIFTISAAIYVTCSILIVVLVCFLPNCDCRSVCF